MSKITSTHRTFEIINLLNAGRGVLMSDLVSMYNVDLRTIRRDFVLIKKVFGDDFLFKKGELYFCIKNKVFGDVLKGKDLAYLNMIFEIIKSSGINISFNKEIQDILKKKKDIYSFNSRLFEDLKDNDTIVLLEHAISYKQSLSIKYNKTGKPNKIDILPYKIVVLNENFYLVGMNPLSKKKTLLRISFIEEVVVNRKTFQVDQEFKRFSGNIQTPFAQYLPGESPVIVVLDVEKNSARHFEKKKYLSSQNIIERGDEGWIKVEYTVTCLGEMTELITKWLPAIRIIEPVEMKDIIKASLIKKLSSLD